MKDRVCRPCSSHRWRVVAGGRDPGLFLAKRKLIERKEYGRFHSSHRNPASFGLRGLNH